VGRVGVGQQRASRRLQHGRPREFAEACQAGMLKSQLLSRVSKVGAQRVRQPERNRIGLRCRRVAVLALSVAVLRLGGFHVGGSDQAMVTSRWPP
jgi:hypothetical protein